MELGAVHLDKFPVRIFAARTRARQQSRLAKIPVITAHHRNARASRTAGDRTAQGSLARPGT
jgi:hypothetical protein